MSLRSDCDAWHRRLYDAAPEHEDSSSAWYGLVREYPGGLTGLHVLDVACVRGGFVRDRLGRGPASPAAIYPPPPCMPPRPKPSVPMAVLRWLRKEMPKVSGSRFGVVVSCEPIEHLPRILNRYRRISRVMRPGGRLLLTAAKNDCREWFLRIRKWICQAGWTIILSDCTPHHFRFFPDRNPLRRGAFEANRTFRKFLSPLAYTYFIATEKIEAAR